MDGRVVRRAVVVALAVLGLGVVTEAAIGGEQASANHECAVWNLERTICVLQRPHGPGEPPSTAMPAGSTVELQVAGVAGVPSNADAVVLNVTVVNAQAAGFATVYPCGQPRPEASNLNFVAGQTIANLVIAKPGTGGKVCIYSYAAIDVLADVSGFFPAGSGFAPVVNPTRILDTRTAAPVDTVKRVGTGCFVPVNGVSNWYDPCPVPANAPAPSTAMPAGSTLELQVAGVAGVPSNADAVVLNMTVVNARSAGFATVYPCGQPRPTASNLNFAAGQTIANLVIAKPGTGGKVCIYSDAPVDVLADVSGFFRAGSGYTPITNPTRTLDTRGFGTGAPVLGAGVAGTGFGGVPSDAVAIVMNVTVVNAQAAGFATVYPCDQPRPEASNLNYSAGQTIPNLVIAKPAVLGSVCIDLSAAAHLLTDVSGYFSAGSGFTPVPNPTRILDTRIGIGT